MQSRLTVAEDKLNVYTTAAASRPTTASAGGAQVSSDEKIKELELRIIRMRTEHQAIQDQLRLEKERVETFQAISQSSEEQLQSLTEAYDTYKADMDRRIEDQQVKVSELEKSNEDLKESLNKSYKDFSELQEKSNLEKTFWERDKKALEDQINHLKQREEEVSLSEGRK